MWAVRLPVDQAAALGTLRLSPGLEIGEREGVTWLRGRELADSLLIELRKLPLADRFAVLADGRLRPADGLVPIGRLPDLDWRPIRQMIEPVIPTAALAGQPMSRCAVTLVRSHRERSANVLIVALEALAGYSSMAPNVRLHACRFAVNASGQALVHGSPLLPLAGERYVEDHGVVCPSGWALCPEVPMPIIADALRLEPGDLALFGLDGRVQRIAAGQFARLTRSAVHITGERRRHA